MAQAAPPEPPSGGTPGDEDNPSRLRFHLWQLDVAVLTALVTAWFCTLGPVPAIVALLAAKHVLVAILVMSLEVGAIQKSEVW